MTHREFLDQFEFFEDESFRIDPIDQIDSKIHDTNNSLTKILILLLNKYFRKKKFLYLF
jgi:hypothetical protein